jgi:hypothetical protein
MRAGVFKIPLKYRNFMKCVLSLFLATERRSRMDFSLKHIPHTFVKKPIS